MSYLTDIFRGSEVKVGELLEGHGFIKFSKSNDGRKVKSPQLSFDYNAIMVCLPSVTYKVEFESAA